MLHVLCFKGVVAISYDKKWCIIWRKFVKVNVAERLGNAKIELPVWVAFQMICEKMSEHPQNALYSMISMISLEIHVFDFEEL